MTCVAVPVDRICYSGKPSSGGTCIQSDENSKQFVPLALLDTHASAKFISEITLAREPILSLVPRRESRYNPLGRKKESSWNPLPDGVGSLGKAELPK